MSRARAYPVRTLRNLEIYFCVHGYTFIKNNGNAASIVVHIRGPGDDHSLPAPDLD